MLDDVERKRTWIKAELTSHDQFFHPVSFVSHGLVSGSGMLKNHELHDCRS